MIMHDIPEHPATVAAAHLFNDDAADTVQVFE